MRFFLFLILGIILSIARGHAGDVDCVKLTENEGRYARLAEYISELESIYVQNPIQQWFSGERRRSIYGKMLLELKEMGVDAAFEGKRLRFLPGDGHQINRTAKWMDGRGIPFYWDLLAGVAVEFTEKNPLQLLWDDHMRGVTMSSSTLKRFVRQNSRTNGAIRHELVHVQNVLNRRAGRYGFFQGVIVGAPIARYEGLYALDEIPAYLEVLRSAQDDLKALRRTEASTEENRKVLMIGLNDSLNGYSRLFHQSAYLADFYRSVLAKVENSSLSKLKIVKDSRGIFFNGEKLASGESFSILLSDQGAGEISKDAVAAELRHRSEFFTSLLSILEKIDSSGARKLRVSDTDVELSVQEKVKVLEELNQALPALQTHVKSGWLRIAEG